MNCDDEVVVRLRRSLQNTQRCVLAMALVLVSTVVLGWQTPKAIRAETISAKEVRLVDDNGRLLAALQHRPDLSDSHGLFLYDKEGFGHLFMMMFKGETPELTLEDPRAHARVRMAADKEDWGLTVFNGEGKSEVSLLARNDGSKYVSGLRPVEPSSNPVVAAQEFRLVDSKGKTRALLGNIPERGAHYGLWVYDDDENIVMRALAENGKDATIHLEDGKGAPRLTLRADKHGGGISVNDEGGASRLTMGTRGPFGYLMMYDAEGKGVVWQVPE